MADELPLKGSEGQGSEQASGQAETPKESKEQEAAEQQQTQEQGREVTEEDETGGYDKTVYQRKLLQEKKRAERQAQIEREGRIAAESRAKTLEESVKAHPAAEKQITLKDVQAALDAGTIDQATAMAYIADIRARQETDRRERERQEQEARIRPLQRAAGTLQQYVSAVPWLADDSDERTQAITQERHRLITEYGQPDNLVTTALAVERRLGPIENLRKQKEVDELTRKGTGTFSAFPAGGNADRSNTNSALSKVPAEMVADWKAMGATDAQMKRWAEYHVEKQKKRLASLGR